MLKKWGHTGKSLFYKSVLVLWAALEPIGYRIIFQKIQYSTRSSVGIQLNKKLKSFFDRFWIDKICLIS